LPELKRVIAAYDERVVMEDTLGGALAALFKEQAPMPSGLRALRRDLLLRARLAFEPARR
jgi:uncharacterized protein